MPRLPIPGSDDGTWGDILNGFLSQVHAADGTLKSNTVGSSQIAANAVTNVQLDPSTQSTLSQVAGKYTKPSTGIPASDLDTTTQAAVNKATTAVQTVNLKAPDGTGAVTIVPSDIGAVASSSVGAVNGVASLDGTSKISVSQVPDLSGTYAVVGQARPGNGWSALGDSITQLSDLEPGINGVGATGSYYGGSWFSYATMVSAQRIRRVKNAGISGNLTSQMLTRLQSDVIAYGPSGCIILGGTNDIGYSVSAGGPNPDATVFADFQSNLRAMAGQLRAAGVMPVLCTIPPNNDARRHKLISQFNNWLRRYAAANGLLLLDFYAQAVDPSTGNYLASFGSPDGTHPGLAGYKTWGQYVASTLVPLLPPNYPSLRMDDTDANDLVTHGLFLGGALSSQGIPPGWNITSGYPTGLTVSLVTDPNVPGDMWQVQAVASSGPYYIQSNLGTSGWASGDTLAVSGVITTDGNLSVSIKLADQSANLAVPFASTGSVARGVFYQEIAVPATSTNLYLNLTTGQGTGTVSYGQMSVRNLTRESVLTP